MNKENNTNSGALLRKIQAIGFAKTEACLYLDAHPNCKAALDYYNKLKNEYEVLVEEFENTHGPLVSDGVVADHWTWVDGVWPWQIEKSEEV